MNPVARSASLRVALPLLRTSGGLLLGVAFFVLSSGLNAAEQSGAWSQHPANELTYLDESDPFYVSQRFPKLTTPQWVGEPGVDAVVILAIDDMTETAKYETFLRPILDRLKQIDGRAPVSIMTRSIPVEDPQAQRWLKEGVSLEAHTIMHPCPLLADGDFQAAATNYYDCIDLLNGIDGNKPVAFRMPCCDSMDSTSPRFFAELFNHPSPRGNFLSIDSSVMNLLTTNDPALPSALVLDQNGRERFRKYFPSATNEITRINLAGFATTVENYPYPYVINRLCWEFPCVVPSDFEASNCHGSTNQLTVSDWEAALDAVVLKRGVFTMIFHPYNWIRNDQLVQLIDYAVQKYGTRIKFLNFREALARLNHNLLLDQPLRREDGSDNGDRLLDLNGDGLVDVIIGNSARPQTRLWDPVSGSWHDSGFPAGLIAVSNQTAVDSGFRFGLFGPERYVAAFYRNETSKGAWAFEKNTWQPVTNFFNGLTFRAQPVLTAEQGRDRGVRLRDVDNDGQCELLVGNETQNAVFKWSEAEGTWKKLPFHLPDGTSIVNAEGQDNGLRLVDLNGDGYDDVVFSNETGYSAHLFIATPKPWLGWDLGWSYPVRSGTRGQLDDIPLISRGGAHPNNGAWFHGNQLFVQNEFTTKLPDHVARVSFDELQLGTEPGAKSPTEALASLSVPAGFKVEIVAAEPQIVDPVAFDWGADGKLWVVEMRDYPLGLDGKGRPGGVIRALEDTNGDGHYDRSTVFMEGIGFPNGIMPWRKGVLVSAAPDIFYAEDTNGDGRADVRRLLYTGFREGNQQHRINGFEYGLDNWVYAANGGSGGIVRAVTNNQELDLRGHDLRIRPDEGIMELQPGATQFGRHRDDWGDWFGNDNSRWLWHYFVPEQYLARNAYLTSGSLIRLLANYENSRRIFTASRPQQRFNWPGALFEVTSACSATPYRDVLFGPQFENSVFICEPANNVIHREVLEPDGVSFRSHRAPSETNSEFFASTDNWCRPVMVKTGPDGALYVADMYRLIIEHPEYFPDELKHRPDLRFGEDKGRIYRIYPEGATLRPIPRLDKLTTSELVAALDSPNGWQRDTVQRLLVEAHNLEAVPALRQIVQRSANPKARLQALGTLSGLGSLTDSLLIAALKDGHWAVRREAVRLAESRFGQSPDWEAQLLRLQEDPDIRVRYQLAFSLGEAPSVGAGRTLGQLMLQDWSSEAMRTAVLSSAPAHLEQVVHELFGQTISPRLEPGLAEQLVELAAEMGKPQLVEQILRRAETGAGQRYQPWQFSAVAGFVSALDRQKIGLVDYRDRATPELREVLTRLGPLFEQARAIVSDDNAEPSQRLVTIRLLARQAGNRPSELDCLAQLLTPQHSPEIQAAALGRLRQLTGPEVAGVLLRSWRTGGRDERQAVLNALFSRSEWVMAVLDALEKGRLSPVELGTLQQQKLLNSQDPGVRERAAKVFASTSSDRKKVSDAYQGIAQLQGNRERGHELFTKNCSICHRLSGEGQSIGPDLGTMADKPVQELVVAILDPNQAVDPAYVAYTAVTKEDQEFSGILVSDSPNSISLRLAGGAEERILRSDLTQLTSSGRSLMPEGFESGLSRQDLADLITFVLNPGP